VSKFKNCLIAAVPVIAVAAFASSAGVANAAPLPHGGGGHHGGGGGGHGGSHHTFREPTELSVAKSPGIRHIGARITGTLTEGWRPLRGELVTIDAVIGHRLLPLASQVTDSRGQVTWNAVPSRTTTYELTFGGTRTLDPSHSRTVTVR
jgi:hypothetical protein